MNMSLILAYVRAYFNICHIYYQNELLDSAVFQGLATNIKKRSVAEIKKMLGSENVKATDDVIKKAMLEFGRILPEEHITGYDLLAPSLAATKELNRNFHYKLETMDNVTQCGAVTNNVLKRLTVMLPHAVECYSDLYKVVGIDGAHMTPVVVRSNPRKLTKQTTITMLTGRTPNNHNTILAYTISYSENSEDISHMLQFCLDNGLPLNDPGLAVISDRGAAILKSVKDTLPLAYNHMCGLHLERNLRKNFGANDTLINFYWNARNAVTESEYKEQMNVLRTTSDEGQKWHDYLVKIDNWQVYIAFERGNKLYDTKTNNISESVNALIKEARELSVFFCHQRIVEMTFAWNDKCRSAAYAHKKHITPSAQSLYDKQLVLYIKHPAGYTITPNDQTELMMATLQPNNQHRDTGVKYRVCLREPVEEDGSEVGTCTCSYKRQTGIPCRHMIALADSLQVNLGAEYFHASARTITWQQMYRRCPSFTGKYPSHLEVQQHVTDNTQVVVGWYEDDITTAVSSKRLMSSGDEYGGGVTKTKLAKSAKRCCRYCKVYISGNSMDHHLGTPCLGVITKAHKKRKDEKSLAIKVPRNAHQGAEDDDSVDEEGREEEEVVDTSDSGEDLY